MAAAIKSWYHDHWNFEKQLGDKNTLACKVVLQDRGNIRAKSKNTLARQKNVHPWNAFDVDVTGPSAVQFKEKPRR